MRFETALGRSTDSFLQCREESTDCFTEPRRSRGLSRSHGVGRIGSV